MVDINPCSIADIFTANLFAEYAAESAIEGLPAPAPSQTAYEAMVHHGLMAVFGAYIADKMVGFVTVLTSTIPHYNKVIATTESIFVAQQYRHTGAGNKLLDMAEQHAKASGAVGLLASAPTGSAFAKVLKHGKHGYRPSNEVFFKCLA